MLLSMAIIGCNYVDTDALVIGFMALAFFGKASAHLAAGLATRRREGPGWSMPY
jgi:ACS family glucarate transporter-like MFS transporter